MGSQVSLLCRLTWCLYLRSVHHTDILKGSFYANPIVDSPTVPEEEKFAYPEYYGQNIC